MEGRMLDSEEKATPVAESEAREKTEVGRAPVQQELLDVQPVVKEAAEHRCSYGAPSAPDHGMCKDAAWHLKEFRENPEKGFMQNCTNGGPSSAPPGSCWRCDSGQHHSVAPEKMPEPIRYWDGTQYRVQKFNEPLDTAFMKLALERLHKIAGSKQDKFVGGNSEADES